MQSQSYTTSSPRLTSKRIRLWYGLLVLVVAVFLVRLFYLQILRHDYYSQAALAGQLKEYEIEPVRGVIEAHDGDKRLPIVLNEARYTLFADPKFINDPRTAASAIQLIIGGQASEYEQKMKADNRYSVLAKKLSKDQKNKLDNLHLKGIGTRETSHRTYPQNSLAAQLLGFVNDEGNGKYGIEQYYNDQLKGTPGQIRAITDAQGVPLLSDQDNVLKPAQNGRGIVLTIDVSIQRQVEDILKAGLEAAKSKSGSVVIIDPNNGAIKAMANYPSYSPAEFYRVEDANVFNNAVVSSPLEVGSAMKTLTATAALDQGVVTTNSTYYDPSQFTVDTYTITNIEEDGGAGTRTLADILQLSLNTGATWLLMQMGGGQINAQARNAWHSYMTKHFGLGQQTGIEQGYEAAGFIPDPIKGYALNLQYANTAFGQGMSATPLQMAAALSSALNGGTYYRPRLIDAFVDKNNQQTLVQPVISRRRVVKPETSKTIQSLMEYVMQKNHVLYGLPQLPAGYSIGGKTGTAEITKPGGGYYDDRFNGVFVGFVGGDKPEYVIVVRVNEPHIDGYAGAKAAAPIFSSLAVMLINNFGVTPKTN